MEEEEEVVKEEEETATVCSSLVLAPSGQGGAASSHASSCEEDRVWPAGSEASSGGRGGHEGRASPSLCDLHPLRRRRRRTMKGRRKRRTRSGCLSYRLVPVAERYRIKRVKEVKSCLWRREELQRIYQNLPGTSSGPLPFLLEQQLPLLLSATRKHNVLPR